LPLQGGSEAFCQETFAGKLPNINSGVLFNLVVLPGSPRVISPSTAHHGLIEYEIIRKNEEVLSQPIVFIKFKKETAESLRFGKGEESSCMERRCSRYGGLHSLVRYHKQRSVLLYKGQPICIRYIRLSPKGWGVGWKGS
jgi:hypothetical protein